MRLVRHLGLALLLGAAAPLPACGDDGAQTTPDTSTGDADADPGDADADPGDGGPDGDADPDTSPPLDPAAVLAFGLDPAQTVSAGPFPSNLYLDGGAVALAPLADDPVVGGLAKPEVIANLSDVANGREGFGFLTGVILFHAPGATFDLASFDGRGTFVALDGPEAGTRVPAVVGAAPTGPALVANPAWGHYLLPDTTYAFYLRTGPKLADGRALLPPAALADVLAADDPAGVPARARAAYAPLRAFLAGDDPGVAAADLLIATVFTTEPALPLAEKVIAAARAHETTPTAAFTWSPESGELAEAPIIEGDLLDDYFGVPVAPFEDHPGSWSTGARNDVAQLPGVDAPYAGGTLHRGIARVVSGSITTPAFHLARTGDTVTASPLRFGPDGLPVADVASLVPFTLYLCDAHVADPSNVPVIVFSHGGGATRSDAIPVANLGCRLGLATIAIDMVFHGGRIATELVPELGLVVPVGPDDENAFTGLEAGDPGYHPDFIGDGGSAATAVAPLFAIPQLGHPEVIEANLLTIAADTATLLETLASGDWTGVVPGLSFDPDRLFHASLSFGTSFHTALFAVADDLRGLVTSVGSGRMLTANLLKAPANALQAAGVLYAVLGLKTPPPKLQTDGDRELALFFVQWLSERGDPLAYAPYVLRHRGADRPRPPVISSGDTWDETLYTPAELSYASAFGFVPYSAGPAWTLGEDVPGADTVDATPHPGETVSGNTTFEGQTTSSAIFYWSKTCHGELLTPVCAQNYVQPHPPAVPLTNRVVDASPICALHHQAHAFLASILAGDAQAAIVAPSGTCEDLYSAD